MPDYKLYYFALRCRAEPIRLLFHYSGTPFQDYKVAYDEWTNLKAQLPFGQLPVLQVDGLMLGQSVAIGRMLAKEFGLDGKNRMEQAQVEMMVEGVYDQWDALKRVYTNKMHRNKAAEHQSWVEFSKRQLKAFLSRYERFLQKSKSGWLVGNSLTWADLAVAEFLNNLEHNFSADTLAGHPKLKEYTMRVLNVPQLNAYLSSRPTTMF